MKTNLILIIAFSLAIFSCKNQPSAANKESDNQSEIKAYDTASSLPSQVETGDMTTKGNGTRLVVFFYSIGSGVETQLIKGFEDSVSVWSSRLGKEVKYEKTPWGREGETDFCMELSELGADQQAQFVTWTRDFLKNGQWVKIYENYPCPPRSRR